MKSGWLGVGIQGRKGLQGARGIMLVLALNASAAMRFVDVNSTNALSPYTNWSTAAVTIQDAVDGGVDGDEIAVTNGVYAIGGRAVFGSMTNRVAIDRAITVQSVNGPGVTWIVGQGVGDGGTNNGDGAIRCVYLGTNAVLSGFTLTNGYTRTAGDYDIEQRAGGVWCETSGVVTNCVLTSNSATNHGGGAYGGTLNNCTLTGNSTWSYGGGGASGSTLNHCTLTGNSARWGGGAFGSTLNHCTLKGNLATVTGGGASGSTLNHCTLIGNWAGTYGGGAATCTLNNCTLTGNRAGYYGGGADTSTLNNCIAYYNTVYYRGPNYYNSGLAYSCSTPLLEGPGNIADAPLFMDTNGWSNLRLQSNSPCINAGTNFYAPAGPDLDGNPRIVGGTVDIGAYEFQAWLYIVAQPMSQTVSFGDTVFFAVNAVGTPPLMYQWQFNGTALSGATNSSLTLTDAVKADEGSYSVLVTNEAGAVTSSNAVLTVNLPPTVSILAPTNGTVMLAPASFSLVAEATDDLGLAQVEFWSDVNSLGTMTNAPWYVVQSNLPAGEYHYTTVAVDILSLAATSAVSTVVVLSQPPTESQTLVTNGVLVRQTGLFYQTVTVSNPTATAFAALRVWVELDTNSVAHGVRVWNATGQDTNGVSYLAYNQPLEPAASVDLLIEYFVPDRRTLPNPVFRTEVVTPESPIEPEGTLLASVRKVTLESGLVLVEFSTIKDRIYYAQYSSDMSTWKTALPAILGTGAPVQWIDNGPPKTESLASSVPTRFYRVVLLP